MKKISVLKQSFVLGTALLFFTHYIQAQNIFPSTGSAGIGTTTPNAKSILEMVSTTKGMLVPRMTKNQRDAILPPATAAGLLIYQTNSAPGFYYYDGTAWKAVTPKAKGWSLTGNAGTDPATNFIGTIDAQPLVLKVNNHKAGYLDYNSGQANTGFGYLTLNSITIGQANTAIGYNVLSRNTSGGSNTASGNNALAFNTSGGSNTVSGFNALGSNTSGGNNTANGSLALASNTTGYDNTADGNNALLSNTIGYSNVAIGSNALFANTIGHNLVAVGDSALFNQSVNGFGDYGNTALGSKTLYSNTVGGFNTATGYKALYANAGYASENTANGAYALTSNTYGFDNTATGIEALTSNTYGSSNTATGGYALAANTYGSFNTAIGFNSLHYTTTGYSNTAIGTSALYRNTTGSNSVAIGDSALNKNTSSLITAVGSWAGTNNTTGIENCYWGASAGFNNSIGSYNNYLGSNAGQNATANSNNFFGAEAGQSNTGGGANTFIGDLAGNGNVGGSYNTYIGAQAFGSASLNNATAIGYNAEATASNQVMLGNTTVTSVKAAGSFVIYSDGRFKKNIKQNVPGLDFINQLKPVTYNYDIHGLNKFIGVENISAIRKTHNDDAKQNEDAINTKEKKLYTGFVAQDVEKAADKLGYDFSGVYKPQNDKDPYGLSYADFVVPLVKAVQELSSQNDSLKTVTNAQQQINNNLQTQLDDLKNTISQMKNAMSQCCSSFSSNMQSSISNQPLEKNIDAKLNQNIPNPFSNTTTISYSLPQNLKTAQIIITDKAGKVLKQVNVFGSGKGFLQLNASAFSSSSYQYSLLVDGKLIDTKQMVLAK